MWRNTGIGVVIPGKIGMYYLSLPIAYLFGGCEQTKPSATPTGGGYISYFLQSVYVLDEFSPATIYLISHFEIHNNGGGPSQLTIPERYSYT